ncbi:hypothetical protein CDL12_02358 [Handroanthus impetiginosus]|uniref:C2 domain-containing protein n=1 Tax=Handroanthus impetiginosus TaxID=429701 RepID=A0A2G9I553_9LAMI|nr:hypothetical protein CDL12_02358 [Handroanthus impetiginosus]
MATGTTPRPPPKLYDLDVTVVSAKHLKNVNWRNGDLKPYVILWVDPDRRQATKPDDSGCTRPVWNERFVLSLNLPPRDSILTLEIFHSKPSETSKPLVGTLRFQLRDLVDSDDSAIRLRSFELLRPSGRPHGKIRLKLGLIERPVENYHTAPPPPSGYYYSSAPPPPMPYRGYSPSPYSSVPPPPPSLSPPPPPPPQPYYSYSDPHSGYYSSYYSPPPPPRPFFERHSNYSGQGPSAPVDYTPYDYQKRNVGKSGVGMGTGLAVGAVAGAMGGLALEEGIKYEEEKIAERVESDLASTARDDRFTEYRSDY